MKDKGGGSPVVIVAGSVEVPELDHAVFSLGRLIPEILLVWAPNRIHRKHRMSLRVFRRFRKHSGGKRLKDGESQQCNEEMKWAHHGFMDLAVGAIGMPPRGSGVRIVRLAWLGSQVLSLVGHLDRGNRDSVEPTPHKAPKPS